MKRVLIILWAAVILASCEETIPIDLEQAPPQIVIEGLVTNEMLNHTVRISSTTGFRNSGVTPPITGASVSVSDGRTTYLYQEAEDYPGLYISETPFVGEIGRTYSLQVLIDGQTYEAQDELLPVAPIDSLIWVLDEEEFESPDDEGEFYDLLVYATEPQETKDFYLFKFYRNGEIENYDGTGVFYSDDELVGEDIEGIEGPVFFSEGDIATFEMYSISREAFVYYGDLDKVLNSDGGMFSPISANPRSNISNGALGLFQVSALVRDSIVIGE